MVALVTADLHLTDNPRDAYRLAFMKKLRAMVRKYKVDSLLILGDITEAKSGHGAWLVNEIVSLLHMLAAECPVIILQGNHDYLGSPDNPFFGFVNRIPKITWISKPCELGMWLFLPHTTNYKRDWADLRLNGIQQIFAHNTFAGAFMGGGRVAEGIPTNLFRNLNIIAGDVHIPQRFGPVTYVGAPYTIDFGDDYNPRVLLNERAGVWKSIPCTGPQKRLIVLDSLINLKPPSNVQEGDIIKVRVNLDPADHAKWPEMQGRIREWGESMGLVVNTVQPVLSSGSGMSKKKRSRISPQSDTELLRQYAKARGVDERTLKVGLKFVEG